MYNIIYSEILKLKRSNILFLILIPALIIPSISLNGTSVEIVSLYGERWLPFLAKMQLLTCFYSPIFITIFSGYIFIREYRENTISGMLTYPISRVRILYSKSILILPIILFQFLLISLFCIFAGWILHLGNPSVGVLFSILRVIMLNKFCWRCDKCLIFYIPS